jgi:3-oxoacyl-[acyl-carrier protein] reductase
MNDTILITGASSEIGINLIQSFEHGEECCILAHYHTNNSELNELIKSSKNKIVLLQADLSSENEVSLLLKYIESNYEVPNKIIHLAAPKISNIRFKNIKWGDFEKDLNISLKSAIQIFSNILPKLAKKKNGKVVIMLSSNVIGAPPKTYTAYTTVKYALLGLMKSLASEYADKNLQINAISPSMVETKFLDNINDKLVELTAHTHPLKRNASTDDITPTIKFLISNGSNYINGINIPITGGAII